MENSGQTQTDDKAPLQDGAFEAVVSYSEHLAHDANNYIGAILGLADVLPAVADDSAQVMKIATRIAAAGRLLQVVINQALLPSSRHGGEGSIDTETALGIVGHMATHLIGPRITFELVPPPETFSFGLSKSEFSTLIFILLRNACDAADMTRGIAPRIRVVFDLFDGDGLAAEAAGQAAMIGCMPKGRVMALRVEDNGAGVAPVLRQNMGAVFRPFVSHSRRKSALGLGLTFATAIAERRGAALAVNQGHKTCFSVYLPVDEVTHFSEQADGQHDSEAATQVLIVDPLLHWGNATATLLTLLGWPACQFTSIAEVIVMLNHAPHQRHVVIFRMPPKSVDAVEAEALTALLAARYNVDLALLVGPVDALSDIGALVLSSDAEPADIANYLIPNI